MGAEPALTCTDCDLLKKRVSDREAEIEKLKEIVHTKPTIYLRGPYTITSITYSDICGVQEWPPSISEVNLLIRSAVVNRKVWGGNRTWNAAHAQGVLTSVIPTCRLRLVNPFQHM